MAFFSRKSRVSNPRTGPRSNQPTNPPPTADLGSRSPHALDEPKSSGPLPSESAIRARAHEIWIARGTPPGDDLADWLRAENELTIELHAGNAYPQQGGST